ncbi:MAG: hypothetical protein JXC32_10420 [Anaerolineae bacterium]|nr:hypothetical protein [Anaerolineae bacterium]
MLTPDGRECPYYYVDAHRRSQVREVCHLLDGSPDAAAWHSDLCARCPVPEIKQANRCETMVLHARIGRRGWRFWEPQRMLIRATCTKSGGVVSDPMVGCGQCHAPISFVVYQEPDSAGDAKEETP